LEGSNEEHILDALPSKIHSRRAYLIEEPAVHHADFVYHKPFRCDPIVLCGVQDWTENIHDPIKIFAHVYITNENNEIKPDFPAANECNVMPPMLQAATPVLPVITVPWWNVRTFYPIQLFIFQKIIAKKSKKMVGGKQELIPKHIMYVFHRQK
jgi:hypothetical protein